MGGYNAGSLIFKLQTLGAQIFKQDQADAKDAVEKTGKAAQTAKGQVDGLGTATDSTGKKSKDSKKPLDEQAKATEEVGKKSKKSSEEQDKQRQSTEQQISAAKQLAATLTVAGVAVAALVTLSVAKSSEFDSAMSNVRAATMSTAAEQRQLGEAALEAGADTAYSASEAAAAQEELAKAGQSVSQIIGGSLNGALALAAAGQLQVARSAEIMATTLTQFRLPAEQAAHVSDVLAAGAGKAQGSVDDLALALSYVGPLAGSVGLSLDETAGTIAYFATQGIIGEKAGTSLRGVLASLQAPSAAANAEMEKYGISVFDGSGNMLSMAGIAEQLKTRLGGLSQQERLAALGRIFGNESLNAATLLYEGGAAAVNEWTAAVDDSGYAAEQARIRQDNLAGDIEKLGGAFDTALIRTGSAANDVLRGMTQSITELVDMYGEAPEPIQATALVLGVATAAILLFAGGAVGARAKFLELKLALDATGTSMSKTALLGGAAGLALTGVITVVGLLMAAQAEARRQAESYADTLAAGTQKVTKATREMIAENLTAEQSILWMSQGSAADAAEELGLRVSTVADAIAGNAEALAEVGEAIETGLGRGTKAMVAQTDADVRASRAAELLKGSVESQIGTLEVATEVARQREEATNDGTVASQSAADAYIEEAGSVEDLNSKLSSLIDTLFEANGVNRDAIAANSDYQEALAKANEQVQNIANGVEGYARGLALTTQAGRDNMDVLTEIASRTEDVAKAQYEADHSVEGLEQRLASGRQALIDTAIQMGLTAEEAVTLADDILGIPEERISKIIADTYDAQTKVDQFITMNNGREIRVKVAADGASIRMGSITVSAPGQAAGGPVRGPGTGTSDSVLRWLSNGEHVITAAEVQAAGGHGAVERWRDQLSVGGNIPVRAAEPARGATDSTGPSRAGRSGDLANSGLAPVGGSVTYIDQVRVALPAADPEVAAVLFADKLRDGFASSPGR